MSAEDQRQHGGGARDFVPPQTLPTRPNDAARVFGRIVVAIVVAIVLLVASMAWLLARYFAQTQEPEPPQWTDIGPFTVLVSHDLPPTQLVVLSLCGIAVIAVCAVSFEFVAAIMTVSPRRRLLSSHRHPSARRSAGGSVEGEVAGAVRVTCLVPAHNEELSLPVTLAALARQTRVPDRVIVVADNCIDRTAQIAREMGYQAFETVDNVHRKAGALNQALSRLLPDSNESDVILVMDADTSLGSEFIEVAARQLSDDPELSAVGGVFYGEGGNGLLGQFQRNEYTRYSLQIRARHGRVFVLTGTATMFRADALLDVAAARGVFIPGEIGKVYDTAALTEDNELTLALKSLGATMTSPPECQVTTEIMPTWRNLWVQRKRWQRGALENLSAYGLTRGTIRYWGQQVGIGYGTVALNLAIVLMAITFLSIDQWVWFPLWLLIGAVFIAERVITAWSGGWRARLLALALIPELCYDVFLQIVFVKCLFDIVVGRSTSWGHVQHQASAAAP